MNAITDVRFDANGFPLNPFGRTGLRGRGLLGKWGPNHVQDQVSVLRVDQDFVDYESHLHRNFLGYGC